MSAIKLITPEIESRLDEVAKLKAATPTFAKLSKETGLSVSYLRQLVSLKVAVSLGLKSMPIRKRQLKANAHAVSHETNCA